MLPDWLYGWLEAFQRFMTSMTPGDLAVGFLIGLASLPLLVGLHELGHAVAVRLRGLPLTHFKVGDVTDVEARVGNLRIELGRLTGAGTVAGYVRYNAERLTPKDLLVIALAGPAASALGTVLCAWLTARWWGHGQVTIALLIATLQSLTLTIANLRPFQDPAGDVVSDGRWAQIALAALRQPEPAVEPAAAAIPETASDPHAATSFGPPGVGALRSDRG